MNTGKFIIPIICIAMLFAGCEVSSKSSRITSATPDTGETIILEPGDVEDFTVTVEDGGYENTDDSWSITNSKYLDTQFFEPNNLTHQGGYLSTQYMPDQESPGSYQMRYTRTDYYTVGASGDGDLIYPADTATKTWDVIVKGIEVLPENSVAMPGESETYKATAYPTGVYTYVWYLDDVQMASGKQYIFTPTANQSGLHTLTVTASGSGGNFTYSRLLIVPSSKISEPEGEQNLAFSPGADGGYYLTGPVYTEVVNNTINNIDSYISQITAQGQVIWRTQCGGDGYDILLSVSPTTDGGCIAAGLSDSLSIGGAANSGSNDGYVVKMNSQGTILWQKLIGSAGSDGIKAIKQTSDGGFIAMGSSDDVLWVLKLNPSGSLVWERTIEGARYIGGTDWYYNDQAGIIIENAGAYLVAGGNVISKLNQGDGSTIWQVSSEESNVSDFIPAIDGGYLYLSTPFEDSSHTVKLNEFGMVMWQQAYTGDTDSSFSCTILGDTDTGGYVIGGRYATQSKVDSHSMISDVENHAMVMMLDKDGALTKRFIFKSIHTFFNELVRIWPMTNGTYMTLYETDGAHYLVPVDINTDDGSF